MNQFEHEDTTRSATVNENGDESGERLGQTPSTINSSTFRPVNENGDESGERVGADSINEQSINLSTTRSAASPRGG